VNKRVIISVSTTETTTKGGKQTCLQAGLMHCSFGHHS